MARRLLLALLLCSALHAQQTPPEPPEEDESLKPKEYTLNPVQAKKEITAGNFYMKKSAYHAAALRYLEASRWDPGSAEAFQRWGEASEKSKDYTSAREAYTKYFEIAEDPKGVDEIKKRMAKWPAVTAKPKDKAPEQLDKVPPIDPRLPANHRPGRL